jgi:hypothetical protein
MSHGRSLVVTAFEAKERRSCVVNSVRASFFFNLKITAANKEIHHRLAPFIACGLAPLHIRPHSAILTASNTTTVGLGFSLTILVATQPSEKTSG